MADQFLLPKKGRAIDLTQPIRPTQETLIRWAKEDLDNPKADLDLKRYSIRELARYGEVDFLKKLKGTYEQEIEFLKKHLGELEKQRFSASLNIGAQVYTEMKRHISDAQWNALSKKEQDKLTIDAYAKYAGPILKKIDQQIKKLERQISEKETLIDEIRRALPG